MNSSKSGTPPAGGSLREFSSSIPIRSLAAWIVEKVESFDDGNEDLLVSVEYAHIYADVVPGEEQRISTEITNSLTSSLTELGLLTRTEVLIDDYNVDRAVLDLPDLLKFLADAGQSPDFVSSESSLEKSALEILASAGRAGHSGRQFSRKRGVVPCSALVAAWYLERFRSNPEQKVLLHGDAVEWFASRPTLLITILPEKYLEVEKLARRLISAHPQQLLSTDRVVTISFSDSPAAGELLGILESSTR